MSKELSESGISTYLSEDLKVYIKDKIANEQINIENEDNFITLYKNILDHIGEELSYFIKWG